MMIAILFQNDMPLVATQDKEKIADWLHVYCHEKRIPFFRENYEQIDHGRSTKTEDGIIFHTKEVEEI